MNHNTEAATLLLLFFNIKALLLFTKQRKVRRAVLCGLQKTETNTGALSTKKNSTSSLSRLELKADLLLNKIKSWPPANFFTRKKESILFKTGSLLLLPGYYWQLCHFFLPLMKQLRKTTSNGIHFLPALIHFCRFMHILFVPPIP